MISGPKRFTTTTFVLSLLRSNLKSGDVISLKVRTKAKQNAVKWEGDVLFIHTSAPAVDGKANAAILKLIKAELGLRAEIVRGEKSKLKQVRIL